MEPLGFPQHANLAERSTDAQLLMAISMNASDQFVGQAFAITQIPRRRTPFFFFQLFGTEAAIIMPLLSDEGRDPPRIQLNFTSLCFEGIILKQGNTDGACSRRRGTLRRGFRCAIKIPIKVGRLGTGSPRPM
ncbi:uncharacterized protein LOC143181145 [Calliopsis andreniformis]|uniref:uncharacterized protein LOC143181145 n=1 Tax=Calliopsis andreniformis TaxID=337506 RepID=UPI003FCD5050